MSITPHCRRHRVKRKTKLIACTRISPFPLASATRSKQVFSYIRFDIFFYFETFYTMIKIFGSYSGVERTMLMEKIIGINEYKELKLKITSLKEHKCNL